MQIGECHFLCIFVFSYLFYFFNFFFFHFVLSIYGLCFRFQNYSDSVFVVETVRFGLLQFITIIEWDPVSSLLFGCNHRELQYSLLVEFTMHKLPIIDKVLSCQYIKSKRYKVC